jgi:hypothetical protein
MTAAAALALAHAHGIAISLDGSDLILESRGSIAPEVRAVIRQAKADLVAALRREVSGAVAGDDLLDALRRKGFVISRYGQDDGTMPPLPEVVAKHDAFFRRLLAWQAPDQSAATGRQNQGLKR